MLLLSVAAVCALAAAAPSPPKAIVFILADDLCVLAAEGVSVLAGLV